jgi:glycine/sarcosine N-methyltransferase
MSFRILPANAFYAAMAHHMASIDPLWGRESQPNGTPHEAEVLGPPAGRSLLDATCGTGTQAIPLAKLGWRVTGFDLDETSLEIARERATGAGIAVDFRRCDVRDLGEGVPEAFDCVISCMALDNLLEDADMERAFHGLFAATKPGGICYIRLRDFENVLRDPPHYEMKEARKVPFGQVFRMEDWLFDGEGDPQNATHLTYVQAFLWEDERRAGHRRWDSTAFGLRRRALRSADLEGLLRRAGYADVEILAKDDPWEPHEVIARKPGFGT